MLRLRSDAYCVLTKRLMDIVPIYNIGGNQARINDKTPELRSANGEGKLKVI